jgi:hypothetical protein
LYPNSWFYNDIVGTDTEDQPFSYSLSTTVFGKTLRRGAQKYSTKRQSDEDVAIYQAYVKVNKNIQYVFKNRPFQ